ncbi:MAG: monovalent cation/H(+) antiporter subunit G [Rhodospirillales bacterium]|nr:monovalent cation/H(+) antiporter subunit G [Rhodospirillales bacterium]MBO6786627.1 monovalent cation/H(+) antiporter subunit G [Rhodospirillales bacterium]
MAAVLDIVSWVFVVGGVVFCLIGGYGLLKLKDVYARLHAASLIDTLGVGLILVGLMFQAGFTLVTAKLVLILVFIFFTTPTATHALARAAINHDVLPEVDTEEERELVRSTKTHTGTAE